MDYDHNSIIIAFSILSGMCYLSDKFKSLERSITNLRTINEVLNVKIFQLEREIEKFEKFKIKVIEKNLVYNENRAWDVLSSDEDDDEDY